LPDPPRLLLLSFLFFFFPPVTLVCSSRSSFSFLSFPSERGGSRPSTAIPHEWVAAQPVFFLVLSAFQLRRELFSLLFKRPSLRSGFVPMATFSPPPPSRRRAFSFLCADHKQTGTASPPFFPFFLHGGDRNSPFFPFPRAGAQGENTSRSFPLPSIPFFSKSDAGILASLSPPPSFLHLNGAPGTGSQSQDCAPSAACGPAHLVSPFSSPAQRNRHFPPLFSSGHGANEGRSRSDFPHRSSGSSFLFPPPLFCAVESDDYPFLFFLLTNRIQSFIQRPIGRTLPFFLSARQMNRTFFFPPSPFP